MSVDAVARPGPREEAKEPRPRTVAYLMSRFPKISETFILYEMVAMEAHGVAVEVYPLWRERARTIHREAGPFVHRAHFLRTIDPDVWRANWALLRERPRTYLRTLRDVLAGTWGSLRYFVGALAIFPKVACFAYRMRASGVDHVHAHFASHPALAAFIIRRLVGIPYSFTAHGSDLHRDRRMLGAKIAEAEFAVAISEYNRHRMLDECPEPDRVRVSLVHCGVDTRRFDAGEERASSSDPSRPLAVACIGTLHEVKGQRYLIDACRQLAKDGDPIAVHLVGDGPDREALRRLAAEAGLAPHVTFHGALTHEEVARLLARVDVVVAPSVPTRDGRREGIPIALMEAMSCGLPVVASRLSGIPELVEDGQNGLLVPPGDAAALTAALQRLRQDPGLGCRLGRTARFTILRDFDLYKNAGTLAGLFGGTTPAPRPTHPHVVPFPAGRVSARRRVSRSEDDAPSRDAPVPETRAPDARVPGGRE